MRKASSHCSVGKVGVEVVVLVGDTGRFPKTEPEEERFYRTQPATASSILPNGWLFTQPRAFPGSSPRLPTRALISLMARLCSGGCWLPCPKPSWGH